MLVGCGSAAEPAAAPSVTMPSPATTTQSSPAASTFTEIGRLRRADEAPVYYVAIGPADESDDAFKGRVRAVLSALAAQGGGPDFSAWVFDELKIGRLTFADADRQVAKDPDSAPADERKTEQHLIAVYSGGDPEAGRSYTISWFPAATPQSPAVGKWVGIETWRP